jgi:hypothetical protein
VAFDTLSAADFKFFIPSAYSDQGCAKGFLPEMKYFLGAGGAYRILLGLPGYCDWTKGRVPPRRDRQQCEQSAAHRLLRHYGYTVRRLVREEAAALLLAAGHAAFAQGPISPNPGLGFAPVPNPAPGAMDLKAAITQAEVFPKVAVTCSLWSLRATAQAPRSRT